MVTMPSASAMTTPSGSASRADVGLENARVDDSHTGPPVRTRADQVALTVALWTACGLRRQRRWARALRVETDGGCRREVEALGPAVDREPHHRVGQAGHGGPEAPTPRCRTSRPYDERGHRLSSSSSRSTSPAPSAARTTIPASCTAAHGLDHRHSGHDRHVEERADARTGPALPLYGSTDSPASTTSPAPAASAQRITVPALPGSRTLAQIATRSGAWSSAPRTAGRRGSRRPRPVPAGSPCRPAPPSPRHRPAASRRPRRGAASRRSEYRSLGVGGGEDLADARTARAGVRQRLTDSLRALGEEPACGHA